jgi:RimJ/RimL family protein N-acetyltransferase
MSSARPEIRVRHAVPSDAAPLCEMLNAIIKIGGTTALEVPLSLAEFSGYFLEGERFLSCFVAEDSLTSRPLGFQGLSRHPELPEDWADIGTFARSEPKTAGAGTALFTQTKTWAGERDLAAINAAIRADNQGGLAYYEKMGFRKYQVAKGVPLRDGTPVDRIIKCYLVG